MADTKKYRLLRGKHMTRGAESGKGPGVRAHGHTFYAGMDGNDIVELTEGQYKAFENKFEPYGATKSAKTRSEKVAADKGKKATADKGKKTED